MTETKDCTTCRYEDRKGDEKPCSKCYNSFAGKPFPYPSEWEAKEVKDA